MIFHYKNIYQSKINTKGCNEVLFKVANMKCLRLIVDDKLNRNGQIENINRKMMTVTCNV